MRMLTTNCPNCGAPLNEKVVAELEEATQFVDLSNPTSPIRHKVSAIHPSVAIGIVRKGGVE